MSPPGATQYDVRGLVSLRLDDAFAFPDRVSAALDTVREPALLVDAPDDLPAYEIRHPYPVGLHELHDPADPYC